MGLSSILTLFAVGGIAAGAFYFRDGIQEAFAGTPKTEEEISLDQEKKEYDFERQKDHDDYWDNVFGGNSTNNSNTKNQTKEITKYSVIEPIEVIDPQTGKSVITYIPNTGTSKKKIAGWY